MERQEKIYAFAISNFGIFLLFSFPATFLFHFFTMTIEEGGLGFTIEEDSIRYLLITVGFLVGLITTPIFGHLSDKTRTRFGRRRIWMIIFAPLMAFTFVLLSIPFFRENFYDYNAAIAYLMIVFIIYSVFVNAVYIPYQGLMADITVPENRLKMSGAYNLIGGLGTAAGLIIPWVVYEISKSWVIVCLVYALILLVTCFITICTIKEPPLNTANQLNPIDSKLSEIPWREIFRNKKFMTFEGSQFFWNLAFNLILAALPAIADAVFGFGTPMEFGLMAVFLLVVLGVFFILYINKGDKWGKQRTLKIMLIYLGIVFPIGGLFFFTKDFVFFPIMYQGIIFLCVLAVGLAAIFVFPMGILMDLITKNQEASYMGVNAIIINGSAAIGTLIMFFITKLFAENAFFVVAPILGIFLLIAGVILAKFSLY